MKFNGSKFSKLVTSLVAAASIIPAVGVMNTSAMEHDAHVLEIKRGFCEKYQNVNGLPSDRVVDTIQSKIEAALALTAVNLCLGKRVRTIQEALKGACGTPQLLETAYTLIIPTKLSLSVDEKIRDNDPNKKLCDMFFNSEMSSDIRNLILDLARNYCTMVLGQHCDAQSKCIDIKEDFCTRYKDGVAGLDCNRVVETIHSIIPAALDVLVLQDYTRNHDLQVAVKSACNDLALIHNMAGLIYPTIISLPDNGGRGPDANDPNIKLWNVLFNSTFSPDLHTLIKDLAIDYCKSKGIISKVDTM